MVADVRNLHCRYVIRSAPPWLWLEGFLFGRHGLLSRNTADCFMFSKGIEMAPRVTMQSRAPQQAPAAFLNLPSIDDLGRAGGRVVDTARNHAIQARARVLFYDRWGRANGTLRGAPEAFQARLDEIARERDPRRARALVQVLTEEAPRPPRKSQPALSPVRRIVERHPLPVRQVARAPEGGYYNLPDAWRNFKRPFDDANASIDAQVSVPMARRLGNLARGDWDGVADDYKRLPGDVVRYNLAMLEGLAATPNGFVNMAARPFTDAASNDLYNLGIGTDVSPEENRERNNQFVGTVGGVASMFAGKVPTRAPKVPAGFKGWPEIKPVIAPRTQTKAPPRIGDAKTTVMNSGGDRLFGSMGSARVNNAPELDNIVSDLRARGVDISFRDGQFAYGPAATRGRPGNIIFDPDGSISAVRHEYGHFLDDQALGFPGQRFYYENPGKRVATERSQYLGEIRTGRQLGDHDARRALIHDYLDERNYLIDNFYTKPYGGR